jgi:hypothetical protein
MGAFVFERTAFLPIIGVRKDVAFPFLAEEICRVGLQSRAFRAVVLVLIAGCFVIAARSLILGILRRVAIASLAIQRLSIFFDLISSHVSVFGCADVHAT